MPASFLDAAGPYALPTGWHEVTTRQYCDLDRLALATVESRASYFAGRPIQVNGLVADALAWMLEPVPVRPPGAGSFDTDFPKDMGQETFLQVESIRALLTAQPLHECYNDVYGLFVTRCRAWKHNEFRQDLAAISARNCPDYPITDTYPAVAHCLAELQRLDAAFAYLATPDETEAGQRAQKAGAGRLAAFGHLNVARHYAREFSTTVDAVYQMPWQTVAVFLVQDRISAEVADNLQKQSSSPAE